MRSLRVIRAWLWVGIALCGGVGGSQVLAVDVDNVERAPDHSDATRDLSYRLQPGDVLEISVWKEPDLQRDALIRPDGSFSFPLAGEMDARGKTVDNVRALLVERLQKFLPTPVVTVAVKQVGGNRVYVMGRVVRAGDFPLTNSLDVMQAIGLAGGVTPFAAVNNIVILRRHNGRQQALKFRYSDVARGHDLAQNIQLQSGDTVVVP